MSKKEELEKCKIFLKNPTLNPFTNRKLKDGSKVQLNLIENCQTIVKTSKNKNSPKTIKSPKSTKSPKNVKSPTSTKSASKVLSLTKKDCDAFNDKGVGVSNKVLKQGSSTYKKYEKICSDTVYTKSPPKKNTKNIKSPPSKNNYVYDQNVCDEFQNNPTKNPRTNRTIKKDSAVYNKLKEECSDPSVIVKSPKKTSVVKSPKKTSVVKSPKNNIVFETSNIPKKTSAVKSPKKIVSPSPKLNELTLDMCNKFLLDPTRNPLTNRKITSGGKAFKDLQKGCNLISEGMFVIENNVKSPKTRTPKNIYKTPSIVPSSHSENSLVDRTYKDFDELLSNKDVTGKMY